MNSHELHQAFGADPADGEESPPLLQQMEERTARLAGSGYSKVGIGEMCQDLNLGGDMRDKLKASLKKFPVVPPALQARALVGTMWHWLTLVRLGC